MKWKINEGKGNEGKDKGKELKEKKAMKDKQQEYVLGNVRAVQRCK